MASYLNMIKFTKKKTTFTDVSSVRKRLRGWSRIKVLSATRQESLKKTKNNYIQLILCKEKRFVDENKSEGTHNSPVHQIKYAELLQVFNRQLPTVGRRREARTRTRKWVPFPAAGLTRGVWIVKKSKALNLTSSWKLEEGLSGQKHEMKSLIWILWC